MQGISHQRLIIYILILGFGPLFFVAASFFTTRSEQEHLELALNEALMHATEKNAKEARNKQVRQLFLNTDHFYIDKEVETLTLLNQEIELIEKALKNGFHHEEDRLKKRLQFLKEQNRIVFTEGSVKAYPNFQETIESLAHPIEVNSDDLIKILSKIETVPSSEANERPHLIITDCKIDRKNSPTQETFGVDLKILKREYLK